MGRTIVFDSKIEECLVKLNGTCSGLIIGSSGSDRDVAVHFAPTPNKYDPVDDAVDSSPKSKKKDQKKINKVSEEDLLDEAWMCQHAKQVTRMLPGGCDILGIFLYGPTELLTNYTPNMRQVLFTIYKTLSKDTKLSAVCKYKERISLQICSVTKKVICRTFDIGDYKSAAKPADWKPLPHPIQWSQIDTEFHLDHWIPVVKEKSKQSLLKQIQTGLEPVYSLIMSSVVMIDGQIRDDSELLCANADVGKKGKSKVAQTVQKQLHQADVFLSLASNNNTIAEPNLIPCGAAMEVKGTFHCRAFIPSKSTVEAATQALKHDIIRSISARYEMHCEDMLFINEEQQDPSLVHELPRRVFTELPGQHITVSDYVYHGDSPKDSLEAFKELLNLNVNEESIDTSYEQSPASQDLLESDMEERLSEAGEQVMEVLNSRRNIILPAVSVAVAATAAGMFYYLLQGT